MWLLARAIKLHKTCQEEQTQASGFSQLFWQKTVGTSRSGHRKNADRLCKSAIGVGGPGWNKLFVGRNEREIS